MNFFVPGIPQSQGSKTAFNRKGGGRPIMIEANAKTKPWRADVREAGLAAREMGFELLQDCVEVGITFFFPRPKCHFNSKGALKAKSPSAPKGKPDIDKLARAVLDALTGVCWKDDAQVVRLYVDKLYGDTPGARIEVGDLGV